MLLHTTSGSRATSGMRSCRGLCMLLLANQPIAPQCDASDAEAVPSTYQVRPKDEVKSAEGLYPQI